MQVRTAFFTIFGDYIRKDDGLVSMPELTVLLQSLGFSVEAVKAAIYRMRHQNILVSNRYNGKTVYTLTNEGIEKMELGLRRTFRESTADSWDGRWTLLLYSVPESERDLRNQLRKEITWLGLGQLTPGTWVSPYDLSSPLKKIVAKYNIEQYVQIFEAKHLGPHDERFVVGQAWDLDSTNEKYEEFLQEFQPRSENYSQKWSDEKTFSERVMLVHEYRKFLHIDPDLPVELLPVGWRGEDARRLFRNYYRVLTDGAMNFYNKVKEGSLTSNAVNI